MSELSTQLAAALPDDLGSGPDWLKSLRRAGAEEPQPDDRARPDCCAGRQVGQRQVDSGKSHSALLRSRQRHHSA